MCIWIWFGLDEEYAKYEIFVVSGLMGGVGTVMLICSLTLIATLVGDNLGNLEIIFSINK